MRTSGRVLCATLEQGNRRMTFEAPPMNLSKTNVSFTKSKEVWVMALIPPLKAKGKSTACIGAGRTRDYFKGELRRSQGRVFEHRSDGALEHGKN